MIKGKHIAVLGAVLAVVGIAAWFFAWWVNPSFATSGTLRYHYADKKIDAVLSDADVRALKRLLVGFSLPDNPSCGFDDDISIRLADGWRSVTFCPACDMCDTVRIGHTNRYICISSKGRRHLEAIVAKYGMRFPCE